MNTSFWGDIDKYIVDAADIADAAAVPIQSGVENDDERESRQFVQHGQQAAVRKDLKAFEWNVVEVATAAVSDRSSQPVEPAAEYDGMDEIEQVKLRYIVGKIAGKDLFNHRGELIIRKNSVITPDIVRVAEAEGKLVELIVNMVLDEFGDD